MSLLGRLRRIVLEFIFRTRKEDEEEVPVERREMCESISRKEESGIRNFMFLTEESHSARILVVQNEAVVAKYPCHREVLRSYIPALDKECNETGTIIIRNHGPEVVELVLRSAYQKPVRLDDWKCARDTLRMAKLYEVEPLIKKCKTFLKRAVTLGNVCYILETCIQCYLTVLEEFCLELCGDAGFVVLNTRAFNEMPFSIVRRIASNPDLNVRNEMTVFQALWNWAKFNCARRTLLPIEIDGQRETLPLTEDCILIEAFAGVSDCVGFEIMTDSQKMSLPNAVQSAYFERISVNPSSNLPESAPIKRERGLRLPNILFKFGESIILKAEEPVFRFVSGTHVSCVKFSLGVDTFLLNFAILCLSSGDQNETPVEKLKISAPTATLLTWEDKANENYIRITEVIHRSISVYGAQMVTETHFVANTVLPLYAGITYQLEIEPRDEKVKWPLVLPQWEDSKFDHNITLNSDSAYGLQRATFLQPA